jgi:AraC-like DNA-binding protein
MISMTSVARQPSPPFAGLYSASYQHFVASLSNLLSRCEIDHDLASQPLALDDNKHPYLRSREWVIGTVKTYIDENLGRALSLDQISEEVHLSKFHLARLFREVEGMPPWRYVQQTRIEKAKELLLDEEKSLVEVALEAGFYDQSHLTNVFKKATGQTPGIFREERKILQEPDDNEC